MIFFSLDVYLNASSTFVCKPLRYFVTGAGYKVITLLQKWLFVCLAAVT